MRYTLILAFVLLSGCASPLQAPAERVVDTIFPEYIKYVNADSKISERSKKRRISATKSFTEAVNSGRN